MRVLVVGANGLLGSNVLAAGLADGWAMTGTYHTSAPDFATELHQLDIRDSERFDALLARIEPDAVVNCAAMTDVDGCEENVRTATAVNGEAPGRMAAYAHDRDADRRRHREGFEEPPADRMADNTEKLVRCRSCSDSVHRFKTEHQGIAGPL